MKSSVFRTVAAIALAAGLCCAGAYAAHTTELSVVNGFSVDTVDIELESVIAQDAPRISVGGSSLPALLDDAAVEHEVTITNEGAPCYVRCKSLYSRPSADAAGAPETFDATGNVVADPQLWVLAGDGYLYRTEAVGEGETVSLVEMISNAPGWRKAADGGDEVPGGFDMTASFMVEAVQARNFEPDFASESPWGDVEPEQCVYSRSGA